MWPQTVLERFRGVRPIQAKERTWAACCPLHKGGAERHPSLSIWMGRNGFLLVRCWVCGAPWRDLVGAVGLMPRDLFPQDDERHNRPAVLDRPIKKVVAQYVYKDECGSPLFRVTRLQPKAFYQERWDASKNKYLVGLHDVRRVVYNLDRIAAEPDLPVIVVEGEKDADRLNALGCHWIATCNPGGTGMGWMSSYSTSLRGRRVAVIPDNDSQGYEHAMTVVGSLLVAGAASVRLVQLPTAVKGADVSDYLDAGGTAESLTRLIREARAFGVMG